MSPLDEQRTADQSHQAITVETSRPLTVPLRSDRRPEPAVRVT